MTEDMRLVHAPEFPPGLTWYNAPQPLTLAGLRGKVILLDFWTYCCINCMHVLPDLKYLEKRFKDEPFQAIGVHCAKFPNEKVEHHVRHAILRHGIEHPVVVDPDFSVWQRYAVRAWPTLVVIDPAGYIVGHLPGEGHRDQIEAYVQQALPHYRAEGVVREGGAVVHLERDADGTAGRLPHGADTAAGRLSDGADHAAGRLPRGADTAAGRLPQGADRAAAFSRGADGTARRPEAALGYPGKIAADPSTGTLWIADTGHHQLVEVRKDGEVLRRIGSGQPGLADGAPRAARLKEPQGLCVAGGMLYVADTGNHALRAVDLDTGRMVTVAGTGEQARHGAKGGPALQTALNSPWDLVHRNGTLYVAMAGAHQLWRVHLTRYWAEPHAGSGREEIADGPLTAAAMAQPSGIALLPDPRGERLVFADSEVSALRTASVDPGGTVETLAGEGLFVFGDRDGGRGEARLQHPLGVTVHDGWIYVADTYNHKVKVYHTEQGVLRTLAGTGRAGFQDGPVARAEFFEPSGLAFLDGTLYVADTNNHALRRIDLAAGTVETVRLG
jgi:sugar lactone lactonase YvrE/thiol-disulfide isomerase/thioredoxin